MGNSLINMMRDVNLFMKSTAAVVLITFGNLVFSPAIMAAQQELHKASMPSQNHPAEQLSAVYAKVTSKLDQYEKERDDGKDVSQLKSQLDNLTGQLATAQSDFEATFAKTENMIKAKSLPAVIMQRQKNMEAFYFAHKQATQTRLDNIHKGELMWKLGRLYESLKQKITGQNPQYVKSPIQVKNPNQFKRSQQAFDPHNLPFKSMQPDKNNKPKMTKRAFTEASLFNSPNVKVAALGDFKYGDLAGASDPAYLAETDEVVLTQGIKDQAKALNYDPVKIYDWVRNNIEWQPTWGAVQNAELTLDARRGNAFDIASLTIALLRASGIPSRYVHGTIEVPIEQFDNWAGGFTDSKAALTYAASGGIPVSAVVTGGKITSVQMEHIWVEAAIDYFPTRGAKNLNADSWVQMDPSYKQYEYKQGLDAVAISGIDVGKVANDFLASGTVNQSEGWFSGLDSIIAESALSTTETALTDYVNTNITNLSMDEAFGSQKVIIKEHPSLPSGLANRIMVEGARYDKIPSSLQQQVTYALGVDSFGKSYDPTTFAWSTLNGEKVTLSFSPATPDDKSALQALLPDGDVTDVSQLPTSIPSYLVNVIPELKVNGVAKVSGQPMALGQELLFSTQIKFPGRTMNVNYPYKVIAGSYLSVNVIAGSVSPRKTNDLENRLSIIKQTFDSNSAAEIAKLTREDVIGNEMYAGSLSYFSQLIYLSEKASILSKASYYMAAGFGTFGEEPKTNYLFGLPVSISPGNITLDVPMNIVTSNKTGNTETKRNFTIESGIISSFLEHATPELLFSTNTATPMNAISAIKAIQAASSQGQKIYTITSGNISNILPLINLNASALQEIRGAVSDGKYVYAHPNPISVPGYTGSGYIIIDPVTGGGAYKLSGGQNGASGSQEPIEKSLTFMEALDAFSGEASIFSKIVGMIHYAMSIAAALFECPTPLAVTIIGMLCLVALIGQGISSIVLTATGGANPALAYGAAFIFAFLLGAWIDKYKEYNC